MEKQQDTPSFVQSSPGTAGAKDSTFHSPVGYSEKIGGSEATIPAADNSSIPEHALNNATALFSKTQHDRDSSAKNNSRQALLPRYLQHHDAGSGVGSTVHGSPYIEPETRSTGNRRQGQRPSGGTLVRSVREKDVSNDQMAITTSLLDPHPLIVPPPGSRLAFAGVNSPVMSHLLRSLPSLEDTLLRRAKEPLCLYNYWQYLANIECGPEELEFWLSLADYEVLYRKFTRQEPPQMEIARQTSGLSLGARQRTGRVESGALGHSSLREGTTANDRLFSQLHDQHIDTFDTEERELDMYLAELSLKTTKAARESACTEHRQCTHSHRPFTAAHSSGRPTLDTPMHQLRQRGIRGFFNRIFSGESAHNEAEPQGQPLLPPQQEDELVSAPTEQEMRRAAEQLFFHYLLSGSPAELRVSDKMREEIASRIEGDERFDAQLFAPAKRHAYEAMRHESHLRFLREQLFHNITRGTAAPRIALGLALIFAALTFQLALIFLDVKPKGWRWLPMAALWPGFAYAFAGVVRLDPFMALLGRYESTAWSFGKVRDSTVRHSHLKRATMLLVVTAGISALITLILFLVPGNRL
ncbi:Bud site selection protein, Revert to axial protein 1 [Coemansia brasiliensis]|uniref:Bud site selection protein, Revert to axial protein 1 n=1 Tax=Coemansia brasiliensis TaxID=2650707 RepID=A0A9W8M3D3_9FUNG|nr:Bud site selection protein, Revert to axial protein 1 [Coemansia brasiliensis]